jgi:NDP-sugar pyrophosphorylase family protein
MPRGPAGSARDAAVQTDADNFIVAEGTIFPRFDLTTVLRTHAGSKAAATVVVAEATGAPSHNGEEPLGVYVLSREALEQVPPSGYQDIKEALLPSLHRLGVRIVALSMPRQSV